MQLHKLKQKCKWAQTCSDITSIGTIDVKLNSYGYFTQSYKNEALRGSTVGLKVRPHTLQNYTTLDCKNDWQLLIFSTPGEKVSWLLLNEACWSRRYKHASGNSHPQRASCAVITVTLRHSSAIEFFTGLRKRFILLRSSCSCQSASGTVTPCPRQSNWDLKTDIEKQWAEYSSYWICCKLQLDLVVNCDLILFCPFVKEQISYKNEHQLLWAIKKFKKTKLNLYNS